LGDDAKTAVHEATNQAYDRMVWWQKDTPWLGAVDVWEYGRDFGLGEKACLRISDHWPIAVQMKPQ